MCGCSRAGRFQISFALPRQSGCALMFDGDDRQSRCLRIATRSSLEAIACLPLPTRRGSVDVFRLAKRTAPVNRLVRHGRRFRRPGAMERPAWGRAASDNGDVPF